MINLGDETVISANLNAQTIEIIAYCRTHIITRACLFVTRNCYAVANTRP